MLREKELRQREEDKSRRDKDRKERELKETAAALQVAISEVSFLPFFCLTRARF